MKKIPLKAGFLILLTFIISFSCSTVHSPKEFDPVTVFDHPDPSSRPNCFWWWFNSLVDKEGITRDLEEFKDKGMGGVTLVCTGNEYGVAPMPSGPVFLSPEWRELYKFAVNECARLGLEMGVNFCGGGWCMGGPWITPEFSSRWYVQSKLTIVGPKKFSGTLPVPGYRDGYDPPYHGNVTHYMWWPEEKADYRDAALVAFRDPRDGSADLGTERLKDLAAKSNRKDGSIFITPEDLLKPTLVEWVSDDSDAPIQASDVIDLTDKFKSDGTLEWEVPEGRWTIQRLGHVCIGCDVRCILPEGDPEIWIEVDWMNPESIDIMFENLGKILIEDAGEHVGKTVKFLHTDSFEDGFPNWTGGMLENFKKYRGYDPTPYLPVFMGKIVGSAEISDRFLYDYRKTVADCMADLSYGKFAEESAKYGLEIECEAGGPSWSGTVCMDGLKNLGRCQRPMGEFWCDNMLTRGEQNYVGKQTASAAHIYGRRYATAESFTSFRHWQRAPEDLKPVGDRAFCEGINRFSFHTMTCSRPIDGLPGNEYGAGTHFNPNVTWWNHAAGPWIEYISRCQALLQRGHFVADVLYYNGDWAPNVIKEKHIDPSLGKGYDYDVCNAEVLLTRLSVKDGRIVLPDGMNYRMLVLPDRIKMPLPILKKLEELIKAGATVIGPKPQSDPGLKDYPQCDKDVRKLANELWGECDGQHVKQNTYGKGRIFWGTTIRDVLEMDGIMPDFEYSGNNPDAFLDFIHRKSKDYEFYFVCNRNKQREEVTCTFRVTGKLPELWDPVTGQRRPAEAFTQDNGRTTLPLGLTPYESVFVVFRDDIPLTQNGDRKRNFPVFDEVQELTGSWNVGFDSDWGGPESVVFEKLEDWRERPEKGIKYYSGTATYNKTFDLPENVRSSGKRFCLDLGKVKNVAKVRLNGKELGVVWTAPWQVDITEAVKPTGNMLEIDIVNLWPNRLIGDAKLPNEQRRTRTNVLAYNADSPLMRSGLLGPVQILTLIDYER